MKAIVTRSLLALACACSLPFGTVAAAQTTSMADENTQAVAVDTDAQSVDEFDQLIAMSANHPNERFRIYAAKAASKGQYQDAAKLFRNAARYADKYSQHRLSMQYWHGVGVASDRVEGYIWADLAAERGYPQFLAIREKMWTELTDAQKADVARRGPAFYAEFGDPVAKKRFETAVAQGKRRTTGSRTGFVGSLLVSTIGPDRQIGGMGGSSLDKLYDESRTDPKKYWEFEDKVWKTVIVEVGDVETTTRVESRSGDGKPADAPKP